MNKYAIRTDIASEMIQDNSFASKSIDGIEVSKIILDEEDGKKIGKKKGLYYSLDTRAVKTHDTKDINVCIKVLTKIIKEVLKYENIDINSKGLIVGLGNINVTPDSLGPLVVDNILVTRHLFELNKKSTDKVSNICALSPGVMGTTGIETFDIIKSVISSVDIDYIIALDALASRALDRVNKTIQVTNAGIAPGSGVGNKRKELSKETIGKPVIAIGVPTVVDAATITSDTIDIIMKYLHNYNKVKTHDNIKDAPIPNIEAREEMFGNIGALSEEEKRQLIDEVLTPSGFNMIVTPKEVDLDIEDLTHIISSALDRALHPNLFLNER